MPWGAAERKDEEKWQVFSQRLGKTVTKEMIKIARVIRHILIDQKIWKYDPSESYRDWNTSKSGGK